MRVPVLTAVEALGAACRMHDLLALAASRRVAGPWASRVPEREVEALTRAGLLATAVPSAYGGPGLEAATTAEVLRLLDEADPDVGRIARIHVAHVRTLAEHGSPSQRAFLLGSVLAGKRLGDAAGPGAALHPAGDGSWTLDGEWHDSTGALVADWLGVRTQLGEGGPSYVAWVERRAPGVSVDDDTPDRRGVASGTVRLSGVRVRRELLTPHPLTLDHADLTARGEATRR